MSRVTGLSVLRQRDRIVMATALETLITSCGATFERREGGTFPGPRCIRLYVTAAQGLCVGIHLDGNSSQPDVFVLSWHMASGATAELNDATFGGSVNKFHRRKATYVACGFEDLRRQLEVGLRLAADGRAFLPKPELIAA